MEQILVFPIDENGYVLWTSDQHRFVPEDYEPEDDEILVPPPENTGWVQPRWNGDEWVEGGRHPDEPEPEALPAGDHADNYVADLYCMVEGVMPIEAVAAQVMDLDMTGADGLKTMRNLCDTRMVPVLIHMVQKMQKRIDILEGGAKHEQRRND